MARTVALAVLLAALLVACGGGGDEGEARTVRVVLDGAPNAVHAPLYAAARHRDDWRKGIVLDLRMPDANSDALAQVVGGSADFGIADLVELALARDRGEPVVAVAAIVQRPALARRGAPAFPGLVLFTRERLAADEPQLVALLRETMKDGYARMERDPAAALDDLAAAAPGLDRTRAAAELEADRRIFTAGGRPYGALDRGAIAALTAWLAATGVTADRVDADALARP